MVEKKMNNAISNDEEPQAFNDNGKRPSDAENKEGKKRFKTKSLYRQPTVNELNRLRETENLFNSNLFRLQVEEILQEVKLKEKTHMKFQKWLEDFKNYLDTIPEDNTEYDLTEKKLVKLLKVKLPVPKELKRTKCIFRFYKFNKVEVVGSYSLGCSINSKLRVDIQITVPAETYTKNDSINYRYHKKRAAYLACVASHLNKSELIEELQYTWLDRCETKPYIDFKPVGKLGNSLTVRINLTCQEEAYKLHRFSPDRNNLREAWLFSTNTIENGAEVGPPTPYYNSSVLSDLTSNVNHEFLKNNLANCENLKQAVVLLNIWLRQRKLQVSGYVISLFVAYLVQTKRINNIMSSYQIVRNVWISLKTSEWDTKGISLYKGPDSTPAIEEFLKHFPVTFLDKTGYYNVCWQMSRGTYNALKRESTLAVEMLDNGKINSFIPLFMTPFKPLMQFDNILRFKNLPDFKTIVVDKASKDQRLNYGLDQLALVVDTLHKLLAKGLGARVDLIQQLVEADYSWPVNKIPKKKNEENKEMLSFGFILNVENALNIVEKGPPANLPEAEEFRAFWGDKSELRRFQDGSITETCVWDGDTIAERRGITKQIINYLMELKYNVPSSELFHICDQLDSLTARKWFTSPELMWSEECSLEAIRAFDDLRRDMRSLTQLPLDVSSVYGISPVFSYSDPLPPTPATTPHKPWRRANACLLKDITRNDGIHCIPGYVPVCRVVVELGHSGKWPGDIDAFRCLKAAFHVQIADRLREQFALHAQAHATHAHVLKNGLVFRLEIAHPKEITLLRREVENGVVKYKESEESVQLQCATVLMPRLRGALHGLHTKNPAYGPTCCVFKRWLSAHLLSPPHFPEIVCELLTASVFVHHHPLSTSAQPTVGFMRVLRLLAETDWSKEMIILDFNEDMTREEITELERQFRDRESSIPCMYIVTAYDGELPSVWTITAPTTHVLARAQILAKSTLSYIEDSLMRDMKDNILAAFVPSLAGYDVLIHLHPTLVPYTRERVDKKPVQRRMTNPASDDVIPIVEFDPVMRYLDELRSAYDEFALFFHDKYGGDVIAVLWKPGVDITRDFQLLNANALKPVQEGSETKYKVNKEALVEDFRIIGEGLVKDITVT